MKYRFSDLADILKLQELMGSLYWLTDIAIGIIDADGTFLFCAGWRGDCTCGNQHTCDCQAYISSHLDPVTYTCRRCPTGMLHYACPIVVEGEHLASVYIGQFFAEPPALNEIELEATKRGLIPAEYGHLLGKYTVIAPMRLTLLLKYLEDLAGMLASIGLQRLQQMEALALLRLNEERLQYLSCHDSLTGLQNRSSFENGLSAMELTFTPSAIMIMDLDGLKKVNDSLGHPAGDTLLRAAANILQDAAPSTASVSRIGGDEFAILLPQTNRYEAEAIRRTILSKVNSYNALHKDLPLGISIGIANAESVPFSTHDLFREADANMYRDKALRAHTQFSNNT
jgi:diguanylate cyclase (GGDEF)-like protein